MIFSVVKSKVQLYNLLKQDKNSGEVKNWGTPIYRTAGIYRL
jgi:hypothetical protein